MQNLPVGPDQGGAKAGRPAASIPPFGCRLLHTASEPQISPTVIDPAPQRLPVLNQRLMRKFGGDLPLFIAAFRDQPFRHKRLQGF